MYLLHNIILILISINNILHIINVLPTYIILFHRPSIRCNLISWQLLIIQRYDYLIYYILCFLCLVIKYADYNNIASEFAININFVSTYNLKTLYTVNYKLYSESYFECDILRYFIVAFKYKIINNSNLCRGERSETSRYILITQSLYLFWTNPFLYAKHVRA